jgi:hypothetical protein
VKAEDYTPEFCCVLEKIGCGPSLGMVQGCKVRAVITSSHGPIFIIFVIRFSVY